MSGNLLAFIAVYISGLLFFHRRSKYQPWSGSDWIGHSLLWFVILIVLSAFITLISKGGLHHQDNLQVITLNKNCKKGGRI